MKNYLVMAKLANGDFINKYIHAENGSMAIVNFVKNVYETDTVSEYDSIIDIDYTANPELSHDEKLKMMMFVMS